MSTVEELIRFEAHWLNRPHDGRYESAVRDVFGVSVTRHAQEVNAALDTVEAARVDPVTVRTLQARRGARHVTGLGSHMGVRSWIPDEG